MNFENDSLIGLTSFVDSEYSRLIKLLIFVPIDVISIPLSILIIHYLYRKNYEHRILSDDILIVLISISLIDIIFQQLGVLIYFKSSYVWPSSSIYCLIWNYFSYLDYYLNLYLTVWASIQRHIMIFYYNLFNTAVRRFFFHKFSLILIILYGIVVYICLIILNSCENSFILSKPWCGRVCFIFNRIEYLYDWLINCVLPICLIIVLNIILLIQVIRQKNRIKQNRFIWRKCRKLTIQMISISSIYIICFILSGIITILRILLSDPYFGFNVIQVCFQYTFLFANALLPFVTLSLLIFFSFICSNVNKNKTIK
ncbi:unnamed protein product [Rotaria sordida]|uniref:G-protein coupled receptors family 1 profile domain-containing protein n=1 Tax=Rotaria sordida TaxID=392033 RepID=A0A816FCW0_9BILA|nr:unnamed protein product [Rotaria sordida]CAF1659356.1 unnamed protein product [Rotaria sordida]